MSTQPDPTKAALLDVAQARIDVLKAGLQPDPTKTPTGLLQLGERFTCKLFADATMTHEWIDKRLLARPDDLVMGGSTHVTWHETKTVEGWDGHVTRERALDLSDPDPTRGTAVFVVVKCSMRGGGCAHGSHDRYDDGWHVEAKREGQAEVVRFSQSGAFTTHVDPGLCVRAEVPS